MKRSRTIGKDDIMAMVIGFSIMWLLITTCLVVIGIPFSWAALGTFVFIICSIFKGGLNDKNT